jgi:hypothetical protein
MSERVPAGLQATPAVHLLAMGCPFSAIGPEGSLTWGISGDLFGDAHHVRISWSATGWHAERLFSPAGGGEEVTWSLDARRGQGGRFRLQALSGPVIDALKTEGHCPTSIATACRFIRSELLSLSPMTPEKAPFRAPKG